MARLFTIPTILQRKTRDKNKVLYRFYTIFGTACCFFLRVLIPLLRNRGGRLGYNLDERFGYYQLKKTYFSSGAARIWIHAASVGEIQVAVNLIDELERRGQNRFFLTVMTEQGRRIADNKLAGRATCVMAPIDVPSVVRRALAFIRPDVFVCVETELWPVLLTEIHRAGIAMALTNGRISDRSFRRYRRIKGLMQPLLEGFSTVSVIRAEDGNRFSALGVPAERILVCGNSKYSYPPRDGNLVRKQYRQRLGLEDATVFICGSTRTGEEELLIPVYEQLRKKSTNRLVWIVAPRHLQRLPALSALFGRYGMETTLLSTCKEACSTDILIVDSMGELADLYAAGDFNFCGGSLVEKGGHNIMEVVRWGRPVYFGPFMDDFRDAVAQVVPGGAGFQVTDAEQLTELLSIHLANEELYNRACRAAGELSSRQCGALRQQAEMIGKLIAGQSARN